MIMGAMLHVLPPYHQHTPVIHSAGVYTDLHVLPPYPQHTSVIHSAGVYTDLHVLPPYPQHTPVIHSAGVYTDLHANRKLAEALTYRDTLLQGQPILHRQSINHVSVW